MTQGGGEKTWVFDQDGNLIISDSDSESIEPSEDGNGFFLYKIHPENDEASCCTRMRLKVRFVYENNKFIPVFQQTIMELSVDPNKE